MKKKLTLYIEDSVKDRAKQFASRNDISVSEMVEQYLDSITREETGFEPKSGSWTESMIGVASLPPEYRDMDYKKIKEREILKKYGE